MNTLVVLCVLVVVESQQPTTAQKSLTDVLAEPTTAQSTLEDVLTVSVHTFQFFFQNSFCLIR